MTYENLCMYCFKDRNGEAICPHCGGDSQAAVPQIQLLPGTLVHNERFLVGRALGQDSGGIVYNALDTKRGGVIRIREYLPRNCAERLNDGGVVPIAGMEEAFDAGMRKLRASVDSVEDPRKRHFYFEENGTAYIAQRKGASGPSDGMESDLEDDGDDRRRQIILYIAIAAAVVLAVAIGLMLFLNSMGASDDRTLDAPLSSTSPGTTWLPDVTPSPTPHATATFAALVDPELSWMDYTYSGDVNSEFQQQQHATATPKPAVQGNQNYPTVNNSSNETSVRELQQYLVKLGWLSSRNVSGRYDDATRSAVREFQRYVNESCSPAEKLAEDGIAGRKTQQWLYNSNVSLTRPTPTPSPKVTAVPNTGNVDANSSASAIRDVQKKLIILGLMPNGSADGRYGSATVTAVRSFQNRVNQLQGYAMLPVTGTVDALTRAWMDYYVRWWQEQTRATAVPSQTIRPTVQPTAQPTAVPGSGTIDASSPRDAIVEVQNLLRQVGLLSASDIDGVYGSRTLQAVRQFQAWVNDLRGENTLSVSGTVDTLTRRYLIYCVENGRVYDLATRQPADPTANPTQEPTPAPEVTEIPPEQQAGADGITPESPTESIEFMQEMLSELGLLDPSLVSGNYGAETSEAVRAFQSYVNAEFDAGLEVSGRCNVETLYYLQQAYDEGWILTATPEPTEVPTVAPTEEPTPEPTAEPTVEPTEEPTPTEEPDGVSSDSSEESIRALQQLLTGVGLLNPDAVDGTYTAATEEAVRALQRAVNAYNRKELLAITGQCDAETLAFLRAAFQRGMDLRELGGIATPDPTELPTTEPTEAPVVGEIAAVHFAVSGQEVSGTVELTPGGHELTWGAEGDFQSYYVYLYDGAGTLIKSAPNTEMNGFRMDTSAMVPGEVYELRVGALPVNGAEDDIFWQSLYLTLPIVETPEPTLAPTPEPSISAPSITIGSAVYQQEGVQFLSGPTAIFSWMADGPVESYTVTLEYQDGTSFPLGTTTDTSRTVNTNQLQPGLYRLRVGATPTGGNEANTAWSELVFGVPQPEATQVPEIEESAQPTVPHIDHIDASSPAEDIQAMQMALYGFGLLDASSVQPGTLDSVTLYAVAAFQQRINETLGANLAVIDPEVDAYIDAQTLDLLLYQDLNLYA